MAFIKFNSRANNPSRNRTNSRTYTLPENLSEVPIFLIPGIFGNSTEMYKLAESLDSSSNYSRPIFIYQEERPDNKLLTMEERAEQVISGMREFIAPKPIPHLIIGYSEGAMLAVETAQRLIQNKENPPDVSVYLIDAVAPECASKYFNSNSTDAIADLVKIMNYAARLANLKEAVFLPEQIEKLKTCTPLSSLEFITQNILEYNSSADSDDIAFFSEMYELAKFKIAKILAKSSLPEDSPKLDKITLLLTTETRDKYHCDEKGGWDKYANKLRIVPDKSLTSLNHFDLLREDRAVSNLASSIERNLINKIKMKSMFFETVSYILSKLQNTAQDEVTNDMSSDASEAIEVDSLSSDSEDDRPVTPPPSRSHSSYSETEDTPAGSPTIARAYSIDKSNWLKSPIPKNSAFFRVPSSLTESTATVNNIVPKKTPA